MELRSLHLRNFRKFKEASFSFSPGINAIVGDNGIGKTNLLEAIYFLITGKSFRTSNGKSLVSWGAPYFYLEAHFVKSGIDGVLKITCDGVEKKIIYNSTPLAKVSSLFGIMLGVVLTPEDHVLVSGPPAIRRRFLDLHIAQFSPNYLNHLSRYFKALKTRNELLKHRHLETIDAWECEMAKSASHVTLERKKAIAELNQQAHMLQLHLSGSRDDLKMSYLSRALHQEECSLAETENIYTVLMRTMREKEVERGTSLVGPHRDDLGLLLQERDARLYASEGQKRSIAASLRLSEWRRLRGVTEEVPLMCVDDVGISLDPSREKHLHEALGSLGQTFFTSPRETLPLSANQVIELT